MILPIELVDTDDPKLGSQHRVGFGVCLGQLVDQVFYLRDGVLVGLDVVLETSEPRLKGHYLL